MSTAEMVYWEAYHRIWPIGPEFWNLLFANVAFHARHAYGYKPPKSISDCLLNFNGTGGGLLKGKAFRNAWSAWFQSFKGK